MKLGFIAMSGVRAHNEELTQLGLTLPGFVDRNKIIASLPSLSLLTLAALTPDSWEVEYREVADLKCMENLPEDYDLAAISTYSAQIFEAYDLADRFRSRGVPVIMGGLHVSVLPEEAKAHCDCVVIGEGEPLWPEVLSDFERGGMAPYYYTQPGGFDLLDPDRYNRLTIQTSRGCPHHCDFCASSILLTPRYKVKPVPRVIEEVRAIKSIWDKPFIEFADDNSFVFRQHYKELLRELAKENVRWFTETDLAVAEDEELLALMRDSGCQQVLIGLESPRPASLDGLELKNNWKLKRRQQYLEAIARIQSFGITVNGCFIFGLDGDTPEVFDEVLAFVRESGLYDVQITFMTPFPGTPLHARLKNEGRLIRDGAWELCTLFDPNFIPRNMTLEELRAGFLRLAKTIYSEEETENRRRHFRRQLRTSPHFRTRGEALKQEMQCA